MPYLLDTDHLVVLHRRSQPAFDRLRQKAETESETDSLFLAARKANLYRFSLRSTV
jgi:hypothetical protein